MKTKKRKRARFMGKANTKLIVFYYICTKITQYDITKVD